MKTAAKNPAAWRAPGLGQAKEVKLDAGELLYHDIGSGPTLVFVHGLLVNANLWRKMVERLSDDYRCVVFDLPIGSHIRTRSADADNSPGAVANLVADAIEALGLEDVTLIGNDSGGLMSQLVVTSRPERIGRLVLTSCDYRDNFPPKMFGYFKPTMAIPGGFQLMAQSLRFNFIRRLPIAYGWLTKRPIDREAEDSYRLPPMLSSAVRADTRKFILGANHELSAAAADRLGEFTKPVLIAWSTEDKVFPSKDAVALAASFPDSQLEWIDDSYTFSMEDNPGRLACLIQEFVGVPATA